MSADPVPNWESIVHKNIRSSDGQHAGHVVAIKGDEIFVATAGDQVHAVIPKSLVASFNGAEVTLNKPYSELGQYEKKWK